MTLTMEDLHCLTASAPSRTTLPAFDEARRSSAFRTPPVWRSSVPGTAYRWPTAGWVEYANLDHAASAPALRVVKDAVDAVLDRYASVHRGAGFDSQLCTALYEGAREPIRAFVGGRADDAVLFTRNTTDAFNLLSHCLPANTTVVVFETEHHATLLPWEKHRVVRLPAPATPEAAVRAVADACRDARKLGPVLVVVTGASNVTGEIWPIARLAAVAHAHGARIALDAAQLAPHRPFSISDLWVDYVALSGHKVYAPVRLRCARRPGRLAGRGSAVPGRWRGHRHRRRRPTVWKPLPDRHEAGTPNIPGVVALATACHALRTADRDALVTAERQLTARLIRGLSESRRHRAFAVRRRRQRHRCRHVHCRSLASPWSPPHCPPSTASACATGRSAPSRWSAGCSARPIALSRRHRARGASLGRVGHHHRARRATGRRRHAGWPARVRSCATSTSTAGRSRCATSARCRRSSPGSSARPPQAGATPGASSLSRDQPRREVGQSRRWRPAGTPEPRIGRRCRRRPALDVGGRHSRAPVSSAPAASLSPALPSAVAAAVRASSSWISCSADLVRSGTSLSVRTRTNASDRDDHPRGCRRCGSCRRSPA